jgi:hypothetical protein
LFQPAIVIYNEETREMTGAALLDSCAQLTLKTYSPKKGEKRIVIDRQYAEDFFPNKITMLEYLKSLIPQNKIL